MLDTHTQLLPLTLYAIFDSPAMIYTLVSLSVMNCLPYLVWKRSPRDFAQWSQKRNQPKLSNIIHLFSSCLSLPLFKPASHPNPRSVSTSVLPQLAFSLSIPCFFLSVSLRAQRKGQRANPSALLGGLSIVIWQQAQRERDYEIDMPEYTQFNMLILNSSCRNILIFHACSNPHNDGNKTRGKYGSYI